MAPVCGDRGKMPRLHRTTDDPLGALPPQQCVAVGPGIRFIGIPGPGVAGASCPGPARKKPQSGGPRNPSRSALPRLPKPDPTLFLAKFFGYSSVIFRYF